jgi:hypothetical protein
LGRVRKSPYTVDWETLIYCRFHSMMKHVLSLRAELTVLHSPFSTQIEKVKRIENSCYSNQKTSNYGCFNPTSSLETSSTAASLTQPRGLKPVNTMVFLASGLLLGVFSKGSCKRTPRRPANPHSFLQSKYHNGSLIVVSWSQAQLNLNYITTDM